MVVAAITPERIKSSLGEQNVYQTERLEQNPFNNEAAFSQGKEVHSSCHSNKHKDHKAQNTNLK